ncbi:MAG: YlbF family regulator, partial [Candidatus Izemoplasmatales bacterium]|nr:YlbF family regulator [Candidatus Izemoplasmatales bacterium]
MNEFEMIIKTYDALDEIKESLEYKQVHLALSALLYDPKSKIVVDKFVQLKQKYEDVMKYGNHHPDYKITTDMFIQSKTDLYKNSLYIEYFNKLKIFNDSIKFFNEGLNEILKNSVIDVAKSCQKV